MAVTIQVPTPLRRYLGGARGVEVEAATVSEALPAAPLIDMVLPATRDAAAAFDAIAFAVLPATRSPEAAFDAPIR